MPGITVDTSPVSFGPAIPGSVADTVMLAIASAGPGDTTVTVSVEEGPGSSGFSAGIVVQTVTLHGIGGGAVEQTSSPVSTESIPPTSAQGAGPGKGSFFLQVGFTAPAAPVPGSFSATLVVSWDGGSTQIPLSGTTASLTARVISSQPLELTAGDPARVEFELTYQSQDSSELQVTLTPATWLQFPRGLTLDPATVTMSPQYVASGSNPKQADPTTILMPPSLPVLVTTRTATVWVTVKSDLVATQLGDSTGQVQVTGFGVDYVKVDFRVKPPQPKVQVSAAQPIWLTPSVPASVALTVSAPGALGTLEFEDTSGLAGGIEIGWPSSASNGTIGIGLGETPVQFTLLAPITDSQATQNAKLILRWTAYDGLRSGKVDIDVGIMPSLIVWQTPNAQVEQLGAGVQGSATWTLRSNGTWQYSGAVSPIGDDVTVSFYFNMWTQPPFMMSGKPTALMALETNSSATSWDQSGFNSLITANWPFFLLNSYRAKLGISIPSGWFYVPLGIGLVMLGGGIDQYENPNQITDSGDGGDDAG